MNEENLIPPSEEPVKIRWLNAAGKHISIVFLYLFSWFKNKIRLFQSQ